MGAALACAFTACSNRLGSENAPSPIPAEYLDAVQRGERVDIDEQGSLVPRVRRNAGEATVDEFLARVGDNVLTRRAVMRRLRVDPAEMGSEEIEEEVQNERLKWASLQLFINGFKQAGLTISPSKLDGFVDSHMKRTLERESERVGEPITRERYLREKEMTWDDFRRDAREQFQKELYVRYKLNGLGGPIRAEVDAHVTPAEVRSVYFNNPEAWNEPSQIRIVIFQIFVKGLADEEHTIVEWEALAERRAEGLARLFRQGVDPERLEAHYQLDQEDMGTMSLMPKLAPTEAIVRNLPSKQFRDWVMAPGRQPRDVTIMKDGRGPVIIGILEMNTGRVVPFDEAYPKIEQLIKNGQRANLEARMLIDMIREGVAIDPPELADELLDEAYRLRSVIRSHKVLKKSRLR